MPVAQGTLADLPGYDAPTFTLMPVGFTPCLSVQVSGFDDIGRLTQTRRLLSASCSSGQRFAFGFLQIPSHPGHPCRSANTSPCRVCRGLPPPSECALPGAPKKSPGNREIARASKNTRFRRTGLEDGSPREGNESIVSVTYETKPPYKRFPQSSANIFCLPLGPASGIRLCFHSKRLAVAR
jgi:hypothetical protein